MVSMKIIVTTIIAGSFYLGIYFGQSRFDKDKIDTYLQLKQLQVDTTILRDSLRKLCLPQQIKDKCLEK
jgi:hypothetical protein